MSDSLQQLQRSVNELNNTLDARFDRDAAEIRRLRERVAELETLYRHVHQNNGESDRCAKCGQGLRDAIHARG